VPLQSVAQRISEQRLSMTDQWEKPYHAKGDVHGRQRLNEFSYKTLTNAKMQQHNVSHQSLVIADIHVNPKILKYLDKKYQRLTQRYQPWRAPPDEEGMTFTIQHILILGA